MYAFVKDGIAFDVGVATMGIVLYFYGRPGISQQTSKRLNALIKNELLASRSIEIYVVIPPDLEWNGLPIHGSAGLELGLIKKYALPWNMRNAGGGIHGQKPNVVLYDQLSFHVSPQRCTAIANKRIRPRIPKTFLSSSEIFFGLF